MEIAPNVHQIEGIPPVSNAYLVIANDGLILIDTGIAWAAKGVLAYIRRLGFEPSAVKAIFITHGDGDHIGGLHALVRQTGAAVVAHQAEVALVEGREVRRPTNPSWADRLTAPIVRVFMPSRPTPVSHPVADGDSVFGLEVIHTPGHSPGSACYRLPAQGVLFVGDAMTHFGGRLALPLKSYTTDMAQAIQSIQRIAQCEFDVCGFGHGPALLHDARAVVADFAARL
ncbi:MAG: MBL fold metallo-hydrolase [Chloroflexi bacterium]|nr:MBL fold metallo-hydrolase [Chloroflexota bacterium]